MRNIFGAVLTAVVLMGSIVWLVVAQEHPGKPAEHPGKPAEHPGKPAAKITAEDIRKGINSYIAKDTKLKGGYFLIWDAKAKRARVLQLVKVHDKLNKLSGADYERIFKTKAPASEVYFACSDFKEAGGKATLDLDFFMQATPAGLEPFRIVIHKENGKPRLTYPPTK